MLGETDQPVRGERFCSCSTHRQSLGSRRGVGRDKGEFINGDLSYLVGGSQGRSDSAACIPCLQSVTHTFKEVTRHRKGVTGGSKLGRQIMNGRSKPGTSVA